MEEIEMCQLFLGLPPAISLGWGCNGRTGRWGGALKSILDEDIYLLSICYSILSWSHNVILTAV